MRVEFDVSELAQFRKELNKFTNDFHKVCDEVLTEQGQMLITEARKRTPVKTGDLKAAWIKDNVESRVSRRGRDYELVIQNNQPYALIIERGKRSGNVIKTTGRHMLKNSENVVRNNNPAERIVAKRIREGLSNFD